MFENDKANTVEIGDRTTNGHRSPAKGEKIIRLVHSYRRVKTKPKTKCHHQILYNLSKCACTQYYFLSSFILGESFILIMNLRV